MTGPQDQEPNRFLVAIVAPFYLAWVTTKAAIEAIARALDALVRAAGDGIRWAWRWMRVGLRGVISVVGSVVLRLAPMLRPVVRVLGVIVRAIVEGLEAFGRQLGVLLVRGARIVARPLRVVARAVSRIVDVIVIRGREAARAVGTAVRWGFEQVWPVVRLLGTAVEAVTSRISAAIGAVLRTIARVVGWSMAHLAQGIRWTTATLTGVLRRFVRWIAAVSRPLVATIRASLAVIRRGLAVALSSVRSAVSATWLVLTNTIRPAIQPVRDAIHELRRATRSIRIRRGDARPDQAHPLAAESDRAAYGVAQAHPAATARPARPARRATPIFVIAVAFTVIVLLVAVIDETLAPGQVTAAILSLLLASAIAGVITAPERIGEGIIGFVLGCALTVAVGILVPNVGGSAEANPLPAFLSLLVVCGIAYAPGWAIGGRRHRRRVVAGET